MTRIIAALFAILLISVAPLAQAADIKFTWSPGDDAELSVFTAYCGPDQGVVNEVAVFPGNTTEGVASDIGLLGSIVCAITATDIYGAESDYSDFVPVEISGSPSAPIIIRIERVATMNVIINN